MTLWTRDELLRYREQRLRDGFPMGPSDHFFGTKTGRRRDPNRFRSGVLKRSAERANETRAEQGLAPLPKIHPTLAAPDLGEPGWISRRPGL